MTDVPTKRRELLKLAGTGVLGSTAIIPHVGRSQSGAPTVDIRQVNRPDFPKISIFFSVRDSNNDPITGLDRSSFSVAEDSVTQSIETVETPAAEQKDDVSVSLVIDRSGSMGEGTKIADTKSAAKQFIERLQADDEAQIIHFGNTVEFAERWSRSKSELKDAVNGISTGGYTALWDATVTGIREAESRQGRSAVIVLTDGKENESSHTKDDVIREGEERGVPVYTIGLGSDISESALLDVANSTGGTYNFAPSSSDLADIYQRIRSGISSEYQITYETRNMSTDGSFRTVEVTVSHSGSSGSDSSIYRTPCAPLPDAAFEMSPKNPTVGRSVEFDAGSSTPNGGSLVAHEWDFDNNGVADARGETATHTYDDHGTYEVRMTVEKGCGASDSSVREIVVTDPQFSISIVGTNTPIAAGEILAVDIELTNTGSTEITTVKLKADSLLDLTERPGTTFHLKSGETITHTFEVETKVGDAGTYTIVAESDDGTDHASVTIEEARGDSFHPSIHGFGFKNYATRDLPNFGEVYNVVSTTFISELQELDFDAVWDLKFTLALAGAVYTIMDGGLTNGHCLGIVNTARRYYNNGVPDLPQYDREVESAADIVDNPEQTASLDPVEADIDEIQHAQAMDPQYALRYLAEVFAPENGTGSIDHSAVIEAIEREVNNGNTASISLVDSSGGVKNSFMTGHQVLAYDIERWSDLVVRVPIYDPNHPAIVYEHATEKLVFSRSSTEEDFRLQYTDTTGEDTYDRAIYLDDNPKFDLEFFDGNAVNGFKSALSRGLSGFISIGVQSPVTLEVTAPDGSTIPKIDIPTDQLKEQADYEALYAGFGVEAGQYELTVTGTGSGSYEIDVKGTESNGGRIDEMISGTIVEGETHTFTATIPEKQGNEGDITEGAPGDTPAIADYAGDGGVVRTSGLREAIDDWRAGEIDTGLLRDVINAWRSGKSVI